MRRPDRADDPAGFVAQVVAFAFGFAASSFFPAMVMGIFPQRMNRADAISGMIVLIAYSRLREYYLVCYLQDPCRERL